VQIPAGARNSHPAARVGEHLTYRIAHETQGVRKMATYEFECRECGATFEVTCHMDEREAEAVCPKCGSHAVDQQFTAAFSSPPPDKY
jgi:putative FmdB family regulatory protein